MNLVLLLFSALMSMYFSTPTPPKEIIVKGKIVGEIPNEIYYSFTNYGIHYGGFNDHTKPDSSGNFQIKIANESAVFVTFSMGLFASSKFILEPGQRYQILIDPKKENEGFEISGPNQKGQELYYNFPSPAFISMAAEYFKKYATHAILKTALDEAKAKDMVLFIHLLEAGEISKPFFDLVKADRTCFYASIASYVALRKSYSILAVQYQPLPIETKQFLANIFATFPVTDRKGMASAFWYEYASSYVLFKEYSQPDFSYKKRDSLSQKGLIHTHNLQQAKLYLPEPMQEYYRAAYLFYASQEEEFEKELIGVYDQYKKDYPSSVYTKYLNERFTEIIQFYDTADKNFTQEIKFIENPDSINSLKSCLAAFKGKKVFIDVWATWCGPCKAEFAYKNQLHEQLQKRNIEPLFISIDDISKNELWKNMIKHYDLQGTHIRTNKAFESDLFRLYDPSSSGISIPWYLIVDEQGNIIKKPAHKPSEMEELIKDLDGK